jgi:hypothetical protein
MMKPKFVTFTGVDDKTDWDKLEDLSAWYPIEWGVLVGGRLGSNRYPTDIERLDMKDREIVGAGCSFSLHMCGEYAQAALFPDASEKTELIRQLAKAKIFGRIQINAGKYDIPNLIRFQEFVGKPVIMQARGKEFPEPLTGIQCLHDLSGGKGRVPKFRPVQPPETVLVGYAGGIGPDNVVQVLSEINAHNFWIDMESKIRDTDDWLDLNKCEAVCKQIWD